MSNKTKGWLSEEDSEHIYIESHDLRIPWYIFASYSCSGMGVKIAREWAVKLQELSIKLLQYATDMEEEDIE